LLSVTEEISALISQGGTERDILHAARRAGMRSISEDGYEKARQGITTLEEIMRTAPPSETSPVGGPPPAPGTQDAFAPGGDSAASDQKPKSSAIRRDRIMIVDDDEAIRRFARKLLESEYYEVIPAVNGKDALDKIFENPPDLIVVDYQMPEMNGLEFIEKLKSHSHLSRIPTIMLTSTDTEETEIKALSIGADDWIQKPIHKERLLARVKRILKSKHP
jgi:CheY-like chemotaxis protein